MQQTAAFSLTSEFNRRANQKEKATRKRTREEAIKRNQINRRAMADWHNTVRAKGNLSEVQFPFRRLG